jgi:Na+-driven multidrug efflux pump
MNQDKTFLGTEPIGKLLRQLAIPTVIAQLVNMLYNIVDRIYIGHIPGDGDLALTGVGVCLPLILIVSAFAALVASGGAPRASIYMGKQDHDTAEKILGGCFALQLAVSAVLTAVLLLGICCWPSAPARTPSATPPAICRSTLWAPCSCS